MNRLLLLLLILLVAQAEAASQTTVISWSAFSSGYGELSSAGTLQRGMAGAPFAGTSSHESGSVRSGFLSGSEILGGDAATVSLVRGWNMLSLPRRPALALRSDLYPGAESFAFAFESLYLPKDTMRVGVGYWLKYSSTASLAIAGEFVLAETIAVSGGWNMIGAISVPVAAVSITSDPPGMVTSEFFGFTTFYEGADTLFPGKAYWVKVLSAGTLALDSTPGVSSRSRITIIPTAEMPPPAPDGAEVDPRSTASGVPLAYALRQNFPNPFNPTTSISYTVPIQVYVTVAIYDLLGREVRRLVQELKQPGEYAVTWDAANAPTGVYFYRLVAGGFVETRKMVLMR